MRRLPPLNALKVVEAAARLESFSHAAAELCVTHGAISKQVDLLEKWLGVRLFLRLPGKVQPTAACRAYQAELSGALDRIAQATGQVARAAAPELLRINAPPTFTLKWLVPRLSRFQIRNPALEIRLRTNTIAVADALRESSLVVRRGPVDWTEGTSRMFLREAITPVCAPALLRDAAVHSIDDLYGHTWLLVDARPTDWADWLGDARQPGRAPQGTLRFDHSLLAIEAAADGMGIAMGPISMLGNELDSGALVKVLGDRAVDTPGYHAICSQADAGMPGVERLRAWLENEGRDSGIPAG